MRPELYGYPNSTLCRYTLRWLKKWKIKNATQYWKDYAKAVSKTGKTIVESNPSDSQESESDSNPPSSSKESKSSDENHMEASPQQTSRRQYHPDWSSPQLKVSKDPCHSSCTVSVAMSSTPISRKRFLAYQAGEYDLCIIATIRHVHVPRSPLDQELRLPS